MLKLCEKLFLRSYVRKLLLLILYLGGIICHLWIFLREGAIQDISNYGYEGFFAFHARLFVYSFVLLLFMAYDYFRELPDAQLLEIVQISGKGLKIDFMQFIVMFQWIALSGFMFFAFFLFGFGIAKQLTGEIFIYLCKIVFLYIIVNGIVAVLLAWLLAKNVGRLLGYVCIILFMCLVSPMAAEEVSFLSFLFREMHTIWKPFAIMPENLDCIYCGTLLPINMSVFSRSLFWLLLFSLLAMIGVKTKGKIYIIVFLLTCLMADAIYMYLPYSYFCADGSYTETDAASYDQMTYMIDNELESKEEDEFLVDSYKMEFTMTRKMDAKVFVYPSDKNLSEYKMTLYHLYNIKSVTDENGNALSYDRDGDYLSVCNERGMLQAILIEYSGCLSNFYANSEFINLPGSFAYYPLPGYRVIYRDYEYVDNRFDERVDFDVTIHSKARVYSDLEQIDENHFAGKGYGPTFLSGFISEIQLENGIRVIYPYLGRYFYDPVTEVFGDNRSGVLEDICEQWKDEQKKTIVFLPVILINIESVRSGSLVTTASLGYYEENLEENGDAFKEKKLDINWAKDNFCSSRDNLKLVEGVSDYAYEYEALKNEWDGLLEFIGEERPSTDDEFKNIFIELFGEEEWKIVEKNKIEGESK